MDEMRFLGLRRGFSILFFLSLLLSGISVFAESLTCSGFISQLLVPRLIAKLPEIDESLERRLIDDPLREALHAPVGSVVKSQIGDRSDPLFGASLIWTQFSFDPDFLAEFDSASGLVRSQRAEELTTLIHGGFSKDLSKWADPSFLRILLDWLREFPEDAEVSVEEAVSPDRLTTRSINGAPLAYARIMASLDKALPLSLKSQAMTFRANSRGLVVQQSPYEIRLVLKGGSGVQDIDYVEFNFATTEHSFSWGLKWLEKNPLEYVLRQRAKLEAAYQNIQEGIPPEVENIISQHISGRLETLGPVRRILRPVYRFHASSLAMTQGEFIDWQIPRHQIPSVVQWEGRTFEIVERRNQHLLWREQISVEGASPFLGNYFSGTIFDALRDIGHHKIPFSTLRLRLNPLSIAETGQ